MNWRRRRTDLRSALLVGAQIGLLLVFLPLVRGAETADPAAPPSIDFWRNAADNPASKFASLQISDWYTINFRDVRNLDANTVVVRPLIPFQTGEIQHLFRATVPIITDNPVLDSGIGDITLFDLIIVRQKWGAWGVGPALLLPTGGSKRGAEKWAIGPAAGFNVRMGKFQWAIFSQNLFTVAGDERRRNVNLTGIQPILSYGLGGGWSVGSSEMNFIYNWQTHRWSSIPLGPRIGKVFLFGRVPVQFTVAYEHDFANRRGDPENIVRFSTRFLFPKG